MSKLEVLKVVRNSYSALSCAHRFRLEVLAFSTTCLEKVGLRFVDMSMLKYVKLVLLHLL